MVNMSRASKDEQTLYSVDDLAKEAGIDESVFAGVKMLKGWKKGKQLTKQAFNAAIDEFLKGSC